jgi:hypothetical protein
MTSEECPICYKKYGEQDDYNFLCKDGKINSDYADVCKHYICEECCGMLAKQDEIKCPLCREDWTLWIHSHYYIDDGDSESDKED